MVIKKASAFSKPKSPAYTRKSKKRKLNFVKGWLPIKIQKFTMGNLDAFNAGKFNFYVKLVGNEPIQIRDNAIEACRRQILRHLDAKVGKNNYYFIVAKYPHQILRENKIATGAGADRTSTGMQLAFGAVVGNAAIIAPGDPIFLIATTKEFINYARDIFDRVCPKLPGKKRIEVEEIK
ncbi:MAG: 50S ribosomal protein L16 [Candidatus Pacearchaeota archaeon]